MPAKRRKPEPAKPGKPAKPRKSAKPDRGQTPDGLTPAVRRGKTPDGLTPAVRRGHVVRRQADVATFCGVSIDSVKNWAKQGMPGKAPSYDLSEIVQWLRRDGPWQPRGGQQLLDSLGDEILLEGGAGSSPALEKLRATKAALAELDLQQRRGQLVSVERSKEIGLRWATLLKRLGERLGKRFGRDAVTAMNDTLEECRRVLDDGYTGPTDAGPDVELVDCERPAAGGKADQPVGRGRGSRTKRASRG